MIPEQRSDDDIPVWLGLLRALRRVPPVFLIQVIPLALWLAFLPTILVIIFFGGGYFFYRALRKLREDGEELADW